MTYTAKNQLYFSLTSTAVAGQYDALWNWYDGDGLRIMSQSTTSSTWQTPFPVNEGTRAYYFYEGSDIALIVERAGSGYQVRSRYVTAGTDQQLVGQFPQGSGMVARLLVPDYQGSTVMALKEGDSLETTWNYCQHDAFGAIPLGTCSNGAGTGNSGTGYTGAASPSAGGGFVYLRNRWYDPQTGRFLTQDPIGLAGGTNLYAYAGGNPVSFADPFGLAADTNESKGSLGNDVVEALKASIGRVVDRLFGGAPAAHDALAGKPQGMSRQAIVNGVATAAANPGSIDYTVTAYLGKAAVSVGTNGVHPAFSPGITFGATADATYTRPDLPAGPVVSVGQLFDADGMLVGGSINTVNGSFAGATASLGVGASVPYAKLSPLAPATAKLLMGAAEHFSVAF